MKTEYEKKNEYQIIINLIKDKLTELEEEVRTKAFMKINIINDLKSKISKEKIFAKSTLSAPSTKSHSP